MAEPSRDETGLSLWRLIQALVKLNKGAPGPSAYVADILAEVAEVTMDTFFIEFVKDLIRRYKLLSSEVQEDKYFKKDFVI